MISSRIGLLSASKISIAPIMKRNVTRRYLHIVSPVLLLSAATPGATVAGPTSAAVALSSCDRLGVLSIVSSLRLLRVRVVDRGRQSHPSANSQHRYPARRLHS